MSDAAQHAAEYASHDLLRGIAHVRTNRDIELDGTPDVYAHILKLASERALDDGVFRERQAFPWLAEASSNVVDFYGTRMTQGTLDNFQQNYKDGVGFMQSHSVRDFIGRSVDGWQVNRDLGNRTTQVIGGFYSIRGIKIGAINTDDFIDAMRAGIISDVSVGFYSDDIRCTICGGQILDWWAYMFDLPGACPHVPLEEYAKLDEDGDPVLDGNGDKIMELAIGDVYDGECVEVSGVYDGAAPGAQVQKAEEFARAGLLSGQTIARLETRYRMKLPDKKKQFVNNATIGKSLSPIMMYGDGYTASATISTGSSNREKLMDTETIATSAGLRDSLKARGVKGDLATLSEELVNRVLDAWDADAVTMERLEVDAALGVKYREDLIDEAIKAGVRAKGADFKSEQYTTILRGLDIEGIKTMREDWVKEGDERLSAGNGEPGGRRTVEGSEPIAITTRQSSRDDAAHIG
jgi:hypothetical protein